MEDKTITALFTMGLIALLEITAIIVLHINGTLLTTTVAAIAGIGGWHLKELKENKIKEFVQYA